MRDMIDEQWRPIEGYEGLYEVSNMGRVKSLERIDRHNHLVKEKILKPHWCRGGYLRVKLCKEGKGKMIMVHRLVGIAFIPNPDNLPQINHRDEDKTNNVVFLNDDGSVDEFRSNLEWCDSKYNNNYGTRNERMTKNRVQSGIDNGTYDPEMCGIKTIDKNKYARLRYQKNLEKMRKYNREWIKKKKQEKKKNNHPSEESLW